MASASPSGLPASPQPSALRRWAFAGFDRLLGASPMFMGIVNSTPDSFSDGGAFADPQQAVDRALALVDQGADLLDIGGESTRPGADLVPAAVELRRVLPVIERLRSRTAVPISIDTTKAEVARAALQSGADIVNDISGLTFDPDMAAVCAEARAGVICMHIQGTPQTMQLDPRYEDVVGEIRSFLSSRLDWLAQQGIPRERVVLDPGIGFGKTPEHNREILNHVADFRSLDRPVCVGHSRKRFLKALLQRPLDERLFATVGVSVALALQQTDIIRVHDVSASRDAVLACTAILCSGSPAGQISPFFKNETISGEQTP